MDPVAARKGNEKELKALIDECQKLAMSLLRGYWNRYPLMCQELLDNVAGYAWEALLEWDENKGAKFSYFFYVKLKRILFNTLRDGRYKHASLEDMEQQFTCPNERPDGAVERADSLAMAQELLDTFDGTERAVMEALYIDGITLRETGERLGFTRQAAEQYKRKGLQKIRERVSRWDKDI